MRLGLLGAKTIVVTGVRDRQGNVLTRAEVGVSAQPTAGALALSEILAAPRTTATATQPVQTEFLEYVNRTDRPISLRSLVLVARASPTATPDTTRFTDVTRVLPPGGFLVLYDTDTSDGPNPATDSRLALAFPAARLSDPSVVLVGRSTVTSGGLTNTGECLKLITTTGEAVTPEICFRDRWADPDRRTGFSLERFSFTRTDALAFAASRAPEGATPGGPNSVQPVAGAQPAQAGDVVISEILYAPRADSRDNRPDQIAYVELYNRSPRVLDLNGYVRLDAPTETGARDTVRIAYAPTRLAPGAYAVFFRSSGIADPAADLRAAFTVPPEAVLLPLSTTPSLPDDGDLISIRTPGGLVVDSVAYDPKWQSAALGDDSGTALERLDPNGPSNSAANWGSSPAPTGGTPGAPNAISAHVGNAPSASGVQAAPGIFSPDGDGVDDVAIFNFRLRGTSGSVRVRLFDANGRLVRTLGPVLSGPTGSVAWDGADGDGAQLPLGIYVALLDAVDGQGGARILPQRRHPRPAPALTPVRRRFGAASRPGRHSLPLPGVGPSPPLPPMLRRALLLPLVLFAACSSEQTYPVQGRVVGFSDDGHTVFVDHEAIAGFMDAMTMPFKLAEGAVLDSTVRIGDAVGFTLHVSPGGSWIDGLSRISDAEVNVSPSGENNRPVDPAAPLPAQIGEVIPDAALLDHTGRAFRMDRLRGKALVVSFIYTRCPLPDYCPALTSKLARLVAPLAAQAGDRARLVTITLDPAFDTPERLARYRAQFTDVPAAAWPFATGDTTEVARLVTAFGVYVKRTGSSTYDHSLVTALVSPDGHLRRVWRDAQWTLRGGGARGDAGASAHALNAHRPAERCRRADA